MAPQILFFFFMMLLVGGVAVDVMRFETRRVTVQQTMDRATLAAASLEQTLNPTAVVNDYFAKAGIGSDLDSVTVTQGMNSRTVKAMATVKSDNYFMSMMDVPYLEAQNRSQAEQRISNVEIALVLDVSGSMYNQATRIANLKTAAKEFVDTVLSKDTQNKVSIALVPYNGQVNLGPTLFSKFTVANAHGYANSYCLDLPTSVYADTTLSRSTAYPQTPFGDSWSGTTTGTTSYVNAQGPTYDSSRGLYSNVWCQPVAGNFVRMHSNNISNLKNQIDGLVAVGATSIDLGMKWGSFLLDPSSRSVTGELAGAGQVTSYFASRPANYGDKDTMKVIVLMTDGENFTQERFGNYRTGNSDIYKSTTDNYYSIFHASKVNNSTSTTLCNSRPFWVPHLGAWHSRPWNGTTPSSSTCYSTTATYTNSTRQTWQQVWTSLRTDWVAWQLYARALGTDSTTRSTIYNTWENSFASYTNTTVMNSRLDQVCEAAKANGVLIYGIAFEAPDGGKTAIQDCASSPSSTYFFDATGLQIQTAFRLIAANLSQLRLTQ